MTIFSTLTTESIDDHSHLVLSCRSCTPELPEIQIRYGGLLIALTSSADRRRQEYYIRYTRYISCGEGGICVSPLNPYPGVFLSLSFPFDRSRDMKLNDPGQANPEASRHFSGRGGGYSFFDSLGRAAGTGSTRTIVLKSRIDLQLFNVRFYSSLGNSRDTRVE